MGLHTVPTAEARGAARAVQMDSQEVAAAVAEAEAEAVGPVAGSLRWPRLVCVEGQVPGAVASLGPARPAGDTETSVPHVSALRRHGGLGQLAVEAAGLPCAVTSVQLRVFGSGSGSRGMADEALWSHLCAPCALSHHFQPDRWPDRRHPTR